MEPGYGATGNRNEYEREYIALEDWAGAVDELRERRHFQVGRDKQDADVARTRRPGQAGRLLLAPLQNLDSSVSFRLGCPRLTTRLRSSARNPSHAIVPPTDVSSTT